MKLFRKELNTKYTIVIGCGRLGANLADTLCNNGENVTIIDKNEESFRKLSPSFGGFTIVGDAMDFDILHDSQIEKADTIIAVTNNDNVNIMIAQIAREIFNIKHIIARLYDPEREYVYKEFEIDTICPAALSEKEVDKILAKQHM